MELPSNISVKLAFETTPKIEEHMLIVMEKTTHEEHLSQTLQINKKQYKNIVTFLTGYVSISKVPIKKTKSISMYQLTM